MVPPPPDRSDIVVIGAGVVGRAVAWQVAQRGFDVTVLEQFDVGHKSSSSDGATGALSYDYENEAYSRLAMHALTWWRVAERLTGRHLLTLCGSLDIGRVGTPSFDRKLATVRDLDLEHELLDWQTTSSRFPALPVEDGCVGLFQPGAGRIDAAEAMDALYELARDCGVRFCWNARVTDLAYDSDGCRVQFVATSEHSESHLHTEETVGGAVCEKLIVCAGAWVTKLTGILPPSQIVRTGPPYVSAADETGASTPRLPMFCTHSDGESSQYRPDGGSGGRPPDRGIRLDWIDSGQRVLLCAGLSGHGFQFAPVVGAAVADLLDGGETIYEIESMKLRS